MSLGIVFYVIPHTKVQMTFFIHRKNIWFHVYLQFPLDTPNTHKNKNRNIKHRKDQKDVVYLRVKYNVTTASILSGRINSFVQNNF